MANTNNQARREVLLWTALVLISIVAAAVINFILEIVNRPSTPQGNGLSSPGDVNFEEMLSSLLHEHLILSIEILAALAIVRLVFLLASKRRQFR